MRTSEYFDDELRGAFMEVENIIEVASTLEELQQAKDAFKSKVKSVEAYFKQIENEIIKGK